MADQEKKKQGTKELDQLILMISNWEASYLRLIDEDRGGLFLIEEFLHEVNIHMAPYITRLIHSGYFDEEKCSEFNRRVDEAVGRIHSRVIKKELPAERTHAIYIW